MRRHFLIPLILAALIAPAMGCGSSKTAEQPDEAETKSQAVAEQPVTPSETGEMAEEPAVAEEEAAEKPEAAIAEPEEEKPLTEADIEAEFQVMGSTSEAQIRGVIGKKKPDVYECYKSVLEKNPGLAGRALVKITTSPTGDVVSAMVSKSNVGNPELERCLTGKIRTWKFPQPPKGDMVIISYPFVFPP